MRTLNSRKKHILRAAPNERTGQHREGPSDSQTRTRITLSGRRQSEDEQRSFEQALSIFLVEWVFQGVCEGEEKHAESKT